MRPQTAIDLIEGLALKPGWYVTAEDYSRRHEGTLKVTFTYDAMNSNQDQAPTYAVPVEGGAHATFLIHCIDCNNPETLLYRVFQCIMRIEAHEWREFLRFLQGGDWHAPFHPHNLGGMLAYAQHSGQDTEHVMLADMLFGVA